MTQGPYHLISIGLLLILSYLVSLLLVRIQIRSTAQHRKFWNTLLLLFFLSTAILGLMLAIKVNYKLDMPIVEKLLVWHVDFGIGMSFIAIFHFTWHWSYYMRIIKGKRDASFPTPSPTSQFRSIPCPSNFQVLRILKILQIPKPVTRIRTREVRRF